MGVNKMFVMLPVMFLARKLDGEDPNIVFMLRAVYGVIQALCVLVVLYTYYQATKVKTSQLIYVPPPALPFGADPDAKKKYTVVSYSAHVLSQARSMVGSTLFGIAMTVGLHLYKGMIVSLAIQSIMGPIGLIDNALVKAVLTGQGFTIDAKLFNEKTAEEITDKDEVVDEQGHPVAVTIKKARSMEELLLDTWDMGNKANLGPLLKALNKKNCNYQTKEDRWTPLMIMSGLGAEGAVDAIRQVREMGANVALRDKEGWTALHWAAFHGQVGAAKELANESNLLAVKDKEGYTPIEMARKEGNDAVAQVYEKAQGESKKSK